MGDLSSRRKFRKILKLVFEKNAILVIILKYSNKQDVMIPNLSSKVANGN
eukprot:TRINITY_DN2940_c0_g1_i1.p2 TRINITY_DN2940_c0_g1~~TRINITY_DN2940_c0_g1_i1.p2  ORF type:complete len:50 (+),score=4.98 TRINITY_DN2940_c0_g1_i1:52-201(+)